MASSAPSSTDRIERHIDIKAPVSRVWHAITDQKEFSAWFGVNLESAFTVGGTVRGRITHPGYEHVVMEVVVRAIEPERYFAYNWNPHAVDPGTDYSKEAPTLVEFHLEPLAGGAGTRLRVVESGFDKVPASRRDVAFRMNSAGWEAQLERIQRYVASPSTFR